MKVGFHLPQWGAGATRDGVLAVAHAVEEAGLDSVWVADHIVHPVGTRTAYPYASEPPFGPEDGFLEALTLLAAVAAATDRVSLGTSVLVLPMRDVLVTAKVLATLDVLSGGRTVVAIGAGWWAEEFAALGHPFRDRGRRLDEQLRVLRRLWTEGTMSFRGEFVAFDELACEPRPVQPGGPPLLIGGTGTRALRRAATLGDGWHALGVHAETLEAGRAEMVRRAEEAGRDPRELTVTTSTFLAEDEQKMVARLVRLARLGVDHVVLETREPRADVAAARIRRFGRETLPRLRERLG